MKKYCTKCGHEFEAVGREVICPACKQAAAEDAKRAAVLRAKKASWAGESVPVRISGRASTVIREYAAANAMAFAESLDHLLKSTDYFKSTGGKWEEVVPYKSRRRDKHTTETAQNMASKPQEVTKASKPQDVPQDVKQAAKQASKATSSKASASKASKAAGKAASKASASKK